MVVGSRNGSISKEVFGEKIVNHVGYFNEIEFASRLITDKLHVREAADLRVVINPVLTFLSLKSQRFWTLLPYFYFLMQNRDILNPFYLESQFHALLGKV